MGKLYAMKAGPEYHVRLNYAKKIATIMESV
jgi:hypothetical protein